MPGIMSFDFCDLVSIKCKTNSGIDPPIPPLLTLSTVDYRMCFN